MNILSLFSGAGGLDIGFHNAGFNIVGCVEIETLFCKTLEKNREVGKYLSKNCLIYNQDIASFEVDMLPHKKIDFVIGGPPCQTFSASGRRIGGAPGLDDSRGMLFEHYCRILEKLNPKGFLFENVRGLLGVNNGNAWKTIVKAFSELGYKLYFKLLDSAAYGIPQHRERIFLVGVKSDQDFLFPNPIYGSASPTKQSYVTAGEVLKDLQDMNEPYHEYNGKYGYLLSAIPEGMNYSFYTAELGHSAPVFAWRSKFSSFLYKIAQDKPVKTIQAQLGKFAGPFHWKNRRLTVAELKRLQSFPDDYEFAGSYDQIMRQIGNSVPPKLATFLAQAVAKQLFDQGSYDELKLMSVDFDQNLDARKGETASQTRTITKRNKITYITNQPTLWDNITEIESPRMTQITEQESRFLLSYSDPVDKVKLLSNSPVVKSKLTNIRQRLFTIETIQDKEIPSKLNVAIYDNDSQGESPPTWKLYLRACLKMRDGYLQIR